MNKHCMSVASLRVGTPWGSISAGARGRGGGDGAVGVRLAHGRGGGGVGRTCARGKSASEFSFILCLSNASDNLQVPTD